MGGLAFRELSVSLARCGEEYTSIATGNGSIAVAKDTTAKLGAGSKPNSKTELMSGLDFNFISQNLHGVEGKHRSLNATSQISATTRLGVAGFFDLKAMLRVQGLTLFYRGINVCSRYNSSGSMSPSRYRVMSSV